MIILNEIEAICVIELMTESILASKFKQRVNLLVALSWTAIS